MVGFAGAHAMLRWQLIPGQQLLHRSWQDEFVLFNNLSGDTHLLGADAIGLLLDLRDSPVDSAELASVEDGAALRELLDSLTGLGLIEVRAC